jgi:hypothetical protein
MPSVGEAVANSSTANCFARAWNLSQASRRKVARRTTLLKFRVLTRALPYK